MDQILEGNATTPIICVTDDETIAYGRVNDCLIYGQETNLYVRCDDGDITAMLDDIPFSKNTDILRYAFPGAVRPLQTTTGPMSPATGTRPARSIFSM
jgi:methenyltetrahydromethanopterin cyclohydrolase